MAIKSSFCDENSQVQLTHAAGSKAKSQALSPLTIQKLMNTGNASGAITKRCKVKNNKTAYVTSDRVHLLSHHTKETGDKRVMSSFQLAANIYKCNSDEFKLKKKLAKKNNKKSVLTLPNEPSILPQTCTVSDMNDCEYYNHNVKPKAPKPKKRLSVQKKIPPNKEYEFYDRDAEYCSQMDVYLDCSSTDVVKNFKGDCRKRTKNSYNSRNKSDDDSVAPHDVWAVLRNINRFQFPPSPPMSGDSSIVTPRRNRATKKKLKRGVYETCRTEQIAYISSVELKPPRDYSVSGSTSVVTVIDNKDGFNKLYEQAQKTFDKNVPRITAKDKREKPMKAKYSNKKTRNNKALCYTDRSSECKTNDRPDVAQKDTNGNASKETLVEHKSVASTKSENTSNRHDSLEDISCRGDICTEVEIQTDLEKKGVIKSRVYGTVGHVGALGDANHQNPNICGRQDARVPPRRPIPYRAPWCNSNTQARPIVAQTRPLMGGPTKVAPGPPKSSWTMSRFEECPTIPLHQATTLAGTDPMRQYTQYEIRKRLAKIKFPLIILGREELSGNFKMPNYESPQFNGLDEHVWPFMLDWTKEGRKLSEPDSKGGSCLERSTNNQRPVKCNKKENIPKSNTERKNSAKLKPILQFRDKMLKFLYKKTSDQNTAANNLACVQGDVKTDKPMQIRCQNTGLRIRNTVNVAISSISNEAPKKTRSPERPIKTTPQSTSPQRLSLPPTSPSKILIPLQLRERKLNWSKAKWASDMIENVIRKVKNGTYYTNDLQSSSAAESSQTDTSDTTNNFDKVNDSKEVSVQVTLPVMTGDFTPKITIHKKKEPLVMLPGFDDTLPPLEIKSMTRNQIAVKHCVTNVLLQFDVNVPLESDHTMAPFKRSTSCIPLTVTDSKTKIFKCKARILNAMLPAELCSIMPKVIKQFLDNDTNLSLTLQEEHKMSELTPSISLTPISESLAPEMHETIKLPLLPQIEIPLPAQLRLRDGRFSKNPKPWTRKSNENIYIVALNALPYEYHSLENGLLKRPIVDAKYYFVAQLDHPPLILPQEKPIETNACTDLVSYSGNGRAYGACNNVYNVPQIVAQFWKVIQQASNSIPNCLLFRTIQLQTYNNYISVNVNFGNHDDGLGTSICINISNLKLGQLQQVAGRCPLNAVTHIDSSEKSIQYIKRADKKEFKKTPVEKPLTVLSNKCKRAGHVKFVKLYKKCKSTSHIAAERNSTPLNKVTNVDEFFQALGAGKVLASALDGSCGKKILSCISELKNWITGITPRQALLVMLLTNKKDTSNLVRFRPVILQGIAVNRITRVTELDMEIEVIERESFNKLPAYPGLPTIVESTQNNESLFEELCWIAKTTASDYQKRFDESSEKLLKSLLEKRKKLNPSYLRVMARYVGLGLLKTPANH